MAPPGHTRDRRVFGAAGSIFDPLRLLQISLGNTACAIQLKGKSHIVGGCECNEIMDPARGLMAELAEQRYHSIPAHAGVWVVFKEVPSQDITPKLVAA
jgi:hypothetical protein